LILIDEAQLLDASGSLEPLRLLLNLASECTEAESALTLGLAGNASLLAHVGRHAALEDRVAVRCVLDRFGLNETAAYIWHRLQVAGAERLDPFTVDAMDAIQELTLGVPRRINRLCDLVLMVGYAQDARKLDASDIENAQRELSIKLQAA
jgi:general secretion pathway protein A